MPTLAKSNDRQLPETGIRSIPTSTPYGQPWWQGLGNNDMPSSGHQEGGSITPSALPSQGNGEGINKDTGTNTAPGAGLNGSTNGQEQQHLDANSQMELVSHSIMLTTYPYCDPQYGGLMTYGAQVHPHLFGYHPARMPLPLEMEEEPVYVNAKQYHGILRRRQIRAKAEMDKKLVKNRKPYLHESRHRHAMRRQRGSGGRFLNTKKADSNSKDSASADQSKAGDIASGQSYSSSADLSSNGNAISGQRGDGTSGVQEIHKEQTPSNGNSNGHGLHWYYTQSTGGDPGNGHFGEDNWNLLMNRAPHGPSSSK